MKTSMLLYLEILIHSTPYTNGGAMTRGVFKVHAFFFAEHLDGFPEYRVFIAAV